ncbi:MAG: DUF3473 domain-containing protein [Chitinophagaceae bacterium]|nr:DUF3473 domain-containing protein [Chitinophagaceae bacterium]
MKREQYILLSFDVEEFDMPLEYQHPIAVEEQMQVGKAGLDALRPLLSDPQLVTTLFTTAHFAEQFPVHIQDLSGQHEIASHTFYHSSFEDAHLIQSKQSLEAITGKPVSGLRMPRMRPVAMEAVKKAGYTYDASINPTWLPGRYNNLHLSRRYYQDQGMLRVPASVSPVIRFPLFWLSFKNLPYTIFRSLALRALHRDGYLSLYFHPWEFVDISGYGMPQYTWRHAGPVLLERLYRLVNDLKKQARFISMQDFTHHIQKDPA